MRGMRGYALLDFPDHSNVGDSAIWLGELVLFDELAGFAPRYLSAQEIDWKALDRLPADYPIFLHGGGNFGDIWPLHQAMRERVIARYRERKIIQLPQSIHFGSTDAVRRAAGVIDSHPDFTLLVRDEQSLAFAEANFQCKVRLCPDSAFALGPYSDLPSPSRDLLVLLRDDVEAMDYRAGASASVSVTPSEDWLDEPEDTHVRAKRAAAYASPLRILMRDRYALRHAYFQKLAERRVKRGIHQLASARYVISDRLHVHILSTLLGIPHAVLDNNYGKIAGFVETWKTNWERVELSHSLDHAMSLERGF